MVPGQSMSSSTAPIVIIALIAVLLLAIGMVGRFRRRQDSRAAGAPADRLQLDSPRRRAQANLDILQAEYTDHVGTDASVQGTLDAAGGLVRAATTAADLMTAEGMIAAARNQLNPGRVPALPAPGPGPIA